jgi:hypothetical protein
VETGNVVARAAAEKPARSTTARKLLTWFKSMVVAMALPGLDARRHFPRAE